MKYCFSYLRKISKSSTYWGVKITDRRRTCFFCFFFTRIVYHRRLILNKLSNKHAPFWSSEYTTNSLIFTESTFYLDLSYKCTLPTVSIRIVLKNTDFVKSFST